MVACDPALTESTKLGPGKCGDVTDSHAGTNETSLMLASCPDKVRNNWQDIGSAKISSYVHQDHTL